MYNRLMKKSDIFNIPNFLSFLRIPLGFIFLTLFLIVQKGNLEPKLNFTLHLISFLVFVCAIITDALDGYYARKMNIVTDIGKHLDPLADCLFFIIIFSTFTITGLMHPILLILILLRESFMHLFLRPFVKRKGKSLPASIFGKIKTFCQCVFSLIILFLFTLKEFLSMQSQDISSLTNIINIIAPILFSIIVFLSLASLIIYLINMSKILND
ncbi:MAG: CDP-diacylglycerol--glycerol-3-phosphate 3-phosphatidyltransferase [Spirochaetales bacterium]|nr:CDP-diacylglycerol--glycerol-3-phosphate 3-phosphatidyltransferase [Spirochaetales bacterium]